MLQTSEIVENKWLNISQFSFAEYGLKTNQQNGYFDIFQYQIENF